MPRVSIKDRSPNEGLLAHARAKPCKGPAGLPSLIFRHNNKTGTEYTIGNYFIESHVGLFGGPAMSDADGPICRWIDQLSLPTRFAVIVAVVAIVIAIVFWG